MKPFFGKPPIDNWRNNVEGGGGGGAEEGTAVRRPSGSGIKWSKLPDIINLNRNAKFYYC